MRASLVRIALAVALCLGVAGCGNDAPVPKPYTGPTESATPSGAPTRPAAARGTSGASARAFLTFYMQTLSAASRSGETEELIRLGSANCKACAVVISNISRVYKRGGRINGRGAAVQDLRVASTLSAGRLIIEGDVKLYPQTTYPRKGAEATHFKGGTAKSRFTLAQVDGNWLLQNWEFL